MGEGQKRACGEKCRAALRGGPTFFSLPTRKPQIHAQAAVCVHSLMLPAADVRASGEPGTQGAG